MRHLTWPITIPLAIVIVALAIANRDNVAVELWPLPFTVDLPLFVLPLGGLMVGFFLGGAYAGISTARWWRRARRSAARVDMLERKLTSLAQEAVSATRVDAGGAAPRLPPFGPRGNAPDLAGRR